MCSSDLSLVFLSCSNTLAVNSSALAAEEEFAEHILAAVLTPTYGGALSGPAGACPPAGKLHQMDIRRTPIFSKVALP